MQAKAMGMEVGMALCRSDVMDMVKMTQGSEGLLRLHATH
jgi:hypothetical protein